MCESDGVPTELDCQHIPDEEPLPILREMLVATIKALNIETSTGSYIISYFKHMVNRMSSYFPKGGHSATENELK